MAVPAVVRFGYGFVQGVDAAATEGKLTDVKVEYVYGNKFAGDPDITAYMDNWYKTLGVQAVFACGGGIYTSAAEAAAKVKDAKVIGVDTDQSFESDTVITSATKGLASSVQWALAKFYAGEFAELGGTGTALGAKDDAVGLPTATWSLEKWSVDDYNALLKDIKDGKVTIDNDWNNLKSTDNVTVNLIK